MKVLITGVAGLLGSNFSRHLISKGYEVVGVDDLSGGYKDFIHLNIASTGPSPVSEVSFTSPKTSKVISAF